MTKKISTRERILDVAIALIWRDGYSAVSVDTICEAAQANKGSFYHAFDTKADLLVAAIERVWAADGAALRAIYAADGDAEEHLRRHLDWFVSSQRALTDRYGFVPGHFHLALNVNVPDAALALIRTHHEAHQDLLLPTIEAVLATRGVRADARRLVEILGYTLNGVMVEARLGNTLEPIEMLPGLAMELIGQAR